MWKGWKEKKCDPQLWKKLMFPKSGTICFSNIRYANAQTFTDKLMVFKKKKNATNLDKLPKDF